jgi:hypothetical protein
MRSLLIAALLASSLPACIVVDDDPGPALRPAEMGALVLEWTIDGVTDPDECDQGDASWLRLSLFTSSGRHVDDFVDACDAFATSVDLPPGDYYAEASLEDADGLQRTTVVTIDDFRILGNDQLSVPIDFPASSFF